MVTNQTLPTANPNPNPNPFQTANPRYRNNSCRRWTPNVETAAAIYATTELLRFRFRRPATPRCLDAASSVRKELRGRRTSNSCSSKTRRWRRRRRRPETSRNSRARAPPTARRCLEAKRSPATVCEPCEVDWTTVKDVEGSFTNVITI